MAKVLSLKELRSSSQLKAEISQLEDEKKQLQEQLDRQKLVENKLRDDIVDHKKDFEHLEKQFEHFAGLEADYEALQQELQMVRLEQLVQDDSKDNQFEQQAWKAREELASVQAELKELKKLDPQRLKRQVNDLKKKNASQAQDNKNLNTALVSARKELRDVTSEKEQLDQKVEAAHKQTDHFWKADDGLWALYETGIILKDEEDNDDSLNKVKAVNLETGISAVTSGLGDDELATWHGDLEIPEDISKEAGKRLKNIAAEAEEDED